MAQTLQLPDKRNLDYFVGGANDGFPLLWIHGTPGAYSPLPPLVRACERKKIKLITFSRAGYGGSTRDKGVSVAHSVNDIQALKQHLGVEQCFVGGWSGGGPYALACAARLPGVVAALSIAGVAPYDAEGLDFLAGQGEDNVQEFKAALQGEAELRKFCEAARPEMLKGGVTELIEAISSILPDVDKKALLDNTELGQYLVDTFHEGLKSNADGWIDDDLAFVQPWGFELSEIKVPVIIYQGAEDKMVPYAQGEWYAKHLPQDKIRAHLQPAQGHISIFLGQVDNILDELRELGNK